MASPEISDIEAIELVLSRYAVGSPKNISPAAGGMMNQNWFVETDQGRFFLRRRSEFFEPESIDFELDLVDRLARSGFPTPPLIRTIDGSLRLQLGDDNWELYKFTQGEKFDARSLSQTRSAAALLARFHKEAARCRADAGDLPYRKVEIDHLSSLIGRFKGHFESDLKSKAGDLGLMAFNPVIKFFCDQVSLSLKGVQALSNQPLVLTHGDFQPSNLLFRGDEAIALLDFGNIALSYRAYDVARGMLSFSVLRPGYKRQDEIMPRLDLTRASAFLKAYQSELPLSREELFAFPAMMRGLYLFGVGFYMMRAPGPINQARLLANALRFIWWLDRSEGELLSLLGLNSSA